MDEIEVRIVNEPTPTCENVTYVLKNWTHCADFNNYRDCVQACGLSTGGAPNVEKRYVLLANREKFMREMWKNLFDLNVRKLETFVVEASGQNFNYV